MDDDAINEILAPPEHAWNKLPENEPAGPQK